MSEPKQNQYMVCTWLLLNTVSARQQETPHSEINGQSPKQIL